MNQRIDVKENFFALKYYKYNIEKKVKAKRDTSRFAIFTAEETVERPIPVIGMAEDVKGGSGYVVKKDSLVLEKWFSDNQLNVDAKHFGV